MAVSTVGRLVRGLEKSDKWGRFTIDQWQIATSVIVERLPPIAPALEDWEIKWELAQRKKFMWMLSKCPDFIKKDIYTYLNNEFFDCFYHGEQTTEDDKTDNVHSPNRRLNETLYLVVKHRRIGTKNNMWSLPSSFWMPEENLRQSAERAVSGPIYPDLKIYFTGITPLACVKEPYPENMEDMPTQAHDLALADGMKTFFYRAYYLSGTPVVQPDLRLGGIQDYAWVNKQKLKKRLDSMVYEKIEPLLDH